MAPWGNRKSVALTLVLFAFGATVTAPVDLGIDVPAQNNYALLRGKRLGLITNQTGVDSHGNHTRVLLKQHCNLVRTQLARGASAASIVRSWNNDVDEFRGDRTPFLLYYPAG